MNNSLLGSIEDTLEWLAPTPRTDPRDALRAGQDPAFAERDAQYIAAAASELADRCLHEAGADHALHAVAARQHWAAPYDADYLVVTFPDSVVFKALDIVALSSREALSFEDLKAAAEKGDQQVVLEMIEPLALAGKPWLTSIPVAEARAGGALYVHHFFLTKAPSGEGTPARGIARQKLLDASSDLPVIENGQNVGGVARARHPAIAPQRTPSARLASTALTAALPGGVASPAAPFQRLFLTLAGPTVRFKPWLSYVILNVEMIPGQTPEADDYIALSQGKPKDALDYISGAWQHVASLDDSFSFATWQLCNKSINLNLVVADLDELATLYIFYARKVNGSWVILGEPVSFQAQKHWMKESLPDIGQKRLSEIVIPGVHDAGTFDLVAKSVTVNAQTQNLTFAGQLALGTRYFDCRLRKTSGSYWFYHGVNSWTNIKDLASTLSTFFTTDGSRDIVILDFCRFQGFDETDMDVDYKPFFEIFTRDAILGTAVMSPAEASQLTVNELFAQGKRLFILCETDKARTTFNLGESINLDSEWPKTNSVSTLKGKLDTQVANHAGSNKLWGLQAILTSAALNPISQLADEVSLVLRRWLLEESWKKTVNVVLCDFSAGADLTHAARVCNTARYDGSKGNLFWHEHAGWQSGAPLPASPPVGVEIGHGGWLKFKSVFATSEGVIYAIDWQGKVNRYRDAHWQLGGAPLSLGASQVAAESGWDKQRTVFASSDGVIYRVDSIGKLWRHRDTAWKQGNAQLGEGVQVDAGWEKYKLTFASNDGVIYAIDSIGKLWRYKDTGGASLGAGVKVDAGWEKYKLAFATSDGVIYAVDWDGNLIWYRDTGSPLRGNVVGSGWAQFRMVFATSQGRIYGVRP